MYIPLAAPRSLLVARPAEVVVEEPAPVPRGGLAQQVLLLHRLRAERVEVVVPEDGGAIERWRWFDAVCLGEREVLDVAAQ